MDRCPVREVMMREIVGDWSIPDANPEWKWLDENATYKRGTLEFVVNVARDFDQAPERIRPVLEAARNDQVSYVIFH